MVDVAAILGSFTAGGTGKGSGAACRIGTNSELCGLFTTYMLLCKFELILVLALFKLLGLRNGDKSKCERILLLLCCGEGDMWFSKSA